MILNSPGGHVRFQLLVQNARLHCAVTLKAASVIEASPIVFSIDGVELTDAHAERRNESRPSFLGHPADKPAAGA